ncbi:Predicted SnoaL-like aldol condensation-catalyzing enzyme [Nitrosospira multiformis]|uniref:Predicted SnoaL-like aldol condensation-catalyzing enzyme n=1 Tax=Nitrosospira multiformis TaxID=1231 RepID=A0A1H8QB47_9PROT|nr:nuclear transport factor 2 family protein [Nitrosospira multiformis]SEO51449.1 Predicted SnoaL-like aldol condensation-catalyzing enzyme [Nitrosospira multiformis]
MKLKQNYLALAALLLAALTSTYSFAQTSERDLAVEEANRKLVVKFYNLNFNEHKVEEAVKVMADNYIQHNPKVPDGKAAFVSFFTGFFPKNPEAKSRIIRSAADGDLVWLHVHATNGANDRGQAIIDIFRVKNGKIVEHWDVIQAVPETAANKNTMF